MTGAVFDTGALIALERGDRAVMVLVAEARKGDHAITVGLLLARARGKDVVDAHVVLCARRREQVVLTSDPDDLRALDSRIRIRRL